MNLSGSFKPSFPPYNTNVIRIEGEVVIVSNHLGFRKYQSSDRPANKLMLPKYSLGK